MTKIALFAFNGELMCFAHVMLNAMEMKKKNYDVKVIIEGTATKLVKEFQDENKPFAKLFDEMKEQNLIDCVCQACSKKMNSFEAVEQQNLPMCNELSGHPSIARYMENGYQILIF